jgi:hypothetical protein
MAYLRPNLLHTGKLVSNSLFLLLLSLWGVGSAGAHATVNVLLFLFGWFQDLEKKQEISVWGVMSDNGKEGKKSLTWNEQSRLSSTLIIAPALSNSPQ